MSERDPNLEAKIAGLLGFSAAGAAGGLYAAKKAAAPSRTDGLARELLNNPALADRYMGAAERGTGAHLRSVPKGGLPENYGDIGRKPPWAEYTKKDVPPFEYVAQADEHGSPHLKGKQPSAAAKADFSDFLERMASDDPKVSNSHPRNDQYRKMLLDAMEKSGTYRSPTKHYQVPAALRDFAKTPIRSAARAAVGGPIELAAMAALFPALMSPHGQEPLPTGGDSYSMTDWKTGGGAPTTADDLSRAQWEQEQPGSRLVQMTRSMNRGAKR